MTLMITPLTTLLKERSDAVWRMTLTITPVMVCVVKGVRVGLGSVEIAVVIRCVTSMTSVVKRDISVRIV